MRMKVKGSGDPNNVAGAITAACNSTGSVILAPIGAPAIHVAMGGISVASFKLKRLMGCIVTLDQADIGGKERTVTVLNVIPAGPELTALAQVEAIPVDILGQGYQGLADGWSMNFHISDSRVILANCRGAGAAQNLAKASHLLGSRKLPVLVAPDPCRSYSNWNPNSQINIRVILINPPTSR